MADSTTNPSQQAPPAPNPPSNRSPNPLLTEPELIAPDSALMPRPPAGRRAGATFIFLTVTLDMLALGMIAPVLPRLIEGFLHGDTSSAAKMLGLFGTVFAAMQFFFSPIIGSLSDRFGRRPLVLLSNFGLGLDYLLMAWAPTLNWLFLGRIISGLTSSSIPTAMAYMADVTPRERRAAAFGMLNAAFGMGFVLGPAVGGLLGNINPRLPFLVAGGLSMVNGMYGLFVLPESLKKENRSRFSWKRANPGGAGALLVKHAVRWISERGAMSVGLICGAIGWVMMGLSKTGMLLWLGIPMLNLMSLVWPSAQSIMSREVGVQEQGQLQGAVNSLR